jgi:hypothetical protein
LTDCYLELTSHWKAQDTPPAFLISAAVVL